MGNLGKQISSNYSNWSLAKMHDLTLLCSTSHSALGSLKNTDDRHVDFVKNECASFVSYAIVNMK